MPNTIFETFYHRMLPLFKPQAEQILTISTPDDFSRVSFRYTFSVEAMIKISHIIEDMVIRTPAVADMHVSFQHLSRLVPQKDRYRRVAEAAKRLWLYGTYDIPTNTFDSLSRTTIIDTTDSSLAHYWFVVAYGPGIGMSLVAEEVPSLTGTERFYEGFYTFELATAYQLSLILHQIFPDDVRRPVTPEEFEG
jgi:DICT domain-containing protein